MLRHYLANLTSLIARALTLGFGKKNAGRCCPSRHLHTARERESERVPEQNGQNASVAAAYGGRMKQGHVAADILFCAHIHRFGRVVGTAAGADRRTPFLPVVLKQ